MARIPWLADVLRANGLTVIEHDGWLTHGRTDPWEPRFGIVHATAAPRDQPDSVQVRIVRDGRAGLPGPIANACVDRWGRWHVLASGRCNTTLEGTAGPYRGYGNSYALGVEACNDNLGEVWPALQYDAYARGWAAICRRLGWSAERLRGHKEHTPGHKTDPTFAMDPFRTLVQRYIDTRGEARPMSDSENLIRVIYLATKLELGGWEATEQDWLAKGGSPADWTMLRTYGLIGQDGRPNKLSQALREIKEAVAARPTVELAEQDRDQIVADLAELVSAAVTTEIRRVLGAELAAAVADLLPDIRLSLVPTQQS